MLEPAEQLLGLHCYEKILALHDEYRDGHFAVIGPAGEHYQHCYFAAVAMSTENLLKSGDDKCRWAGRGGMGSVMGSKNLIGIVAECPDQFTRPAPGIRDLNKEIATGPGSRKFREATKGGLGDTWANYEPLDQFSFVPELNFRPQGNDRAKKMYRSAVEPEFIIKAESCFRCGINCHKNIYERAPDGLAGSFRAKFDYEPLNLLSTNIGVDDPHQVWPLVALVDRLGMDAISIGTTIAYVLDYNERHSGAPNLNGARFGDAARVAELIAQTGTGQCPEIGRGVKRLSRLTWRERVCNACEGAGATSLPPRHQPGIPLGRSQAGICRWPPTCCSRLRVTRASNIWTKAITERGLYFVRDDLLGLCKFAMLNIDHAPRALSHEVGLEISKTSCARRSAAARSFARCGSNGSMATCKRTTPSRRRSSTDPTRRSSSRRRS